MGDNTMQEQQRTVEEQQAANFAHFMERGPAISTGYGAYVVRRDDANNRVELGGLGGLGIGTMWVESRERYKSYPGWDDAEHVTTQLTRTRSFIDDLNAAIGDK